MLDGEPVDLESTNEAVDRGIAIIHQELNLCPEPQRARQHLHRPRDCARRTGAIDYGREREITSR